MTQSCEGLPCSLRLELLRACCCCLPEVVLLPLLLLLLLLLLLPCLMRLT